MKKLKNILSKALSLALILAMCSGMTIGAEVIEWQSVFTQNFDSMTEIPAGYVTDTDPAFKANITEGALETKYISSAYIAASGYNGKVITTTDDSSFIDILKNDGSITVDPTATLVTPAYTFKVNSSTGDNTPCVIDMGGSKSYRIGSHAVGDVRLRYNRLWLHVDKENKVFTANDNNARIIVEYYAVDNTPDEDFGMNQSLTFEYKNISDGFSSQTVSIPEEKLETWQTWVFDVNDIDFTKKVDKNSDYYNIRFQTPYIGSKLELTDELNNKATTQYFKEQMKDPGFEVYVRSVRILKLSAETTPQFDNTKKTVQIPLGAGGNCGDSKVTFDLNISAEDYAVNGAYRVSLANNDGQELATLQIEDNGNGTQSIYTVGSNDSGEEVKSSALYTGSVLDQTLTCTLEMSFRDKTYKLAVSSNGINVPETEACKIRNFDDVTSAFGDRLVVTHAKNSAGTIATIDNISLEFKEDESGVKAKEDLDKMAETPLVPDPFEEIEELINVGPLNSSTIEWSIKSGEDFIESLEKDENGIWKITPDCGAEPKSVILTATAKVGDDGVPCSKDFTITVAEHANHVKLRNVKDALAITDVNITEPVAAEEFNLPNSEVEGVTVEWSCRPEDAEAITVDGYAATLSHGEEDIEVVLTAEVSCGIFTETRDFTITVKEHADHIRLREIIETGRIDGVFAGTPVAKDFPLTLIVGDNEVIDDETVSIEWVSSDENKEDGPAIIPSNGIAEVSRGGEPTNITLTATITCGDFTSTKTFTITVASLEGVYAIIPEEPLVGTPYTDENGVEVVDVEVTVETPGINGEVTFVALALDSEGGKVVDRESQTLTVNAYGNPTFNITGLKNTGVKEYYFWDENGASIRNNEPTKIDDLVAKERATGVWLSWSPSYDDNGELSYYQIYRDGEAEPYKMLMSENVVMDEDGNVKYFIEGEDVEVNHTYEVVPFDKNELKPEENSRVEAKVLQMYSYDFETQTSTLGLAAQTNGVNYAYWTTVTHEGVTCASAEKGKAISLVVPSGIANQRAITFVIEYYANGTNKLVLDHMKGGANTDANRYQYPITNPHETVNEWNTVVVNLDPVYFFKAGKISGADFNVKAVDGANYVRKVSIIETDKYYEY